MTPHRARRRDRSTAPESRTLAPAAPSARLALPARLRPARHEPGACRVVRALGRLLHRVGSAVSDYRRRQALQRELARLDPHQLKDIGLTRADLPAVIDGSFVGDESRLPRGTPAADRARR